MAGLVELFYYLAVLLRGAALATQSLTVGGVVFSWLARDRLVASSEENVRRLLVCSAIGLAGFEAISAAVGGAVIRTMVELPIRQIITAGFFTANMTGAISAMSLVAFARRGPIERSPAVLALVLLILGSTLATSHAVARVTHPVAMSIATLSHHTATACWIGGLPYLVIALARSAPSDAARIIERFSSLAQISVPLLVSASVAMYIGFIGSREALFGTTYGLMVVGKIVLFASVLVLGAFNFFLAKRVRGGEMDALGRLRSFSGAEIGIGFTIIFTAASLTSQPPAVDLTVDRVNWQELIARTTPRWPPRWNTPPLSDLSPATPLNPAEAGEYGRLETYVPGAAIYTPPKPGDIAWSEYNHNWAGIIVMTVGILAMLARTRWPGTAWAKHWPLAFLGLGLFLLLRADPENWPLGPRGFFESFQVPEVLQHRVFVALIAILAVFEWSVRTGRIHSRKAAYVFPVLCALGGALLLTHSHSVGNIKEEMLQEAAHIPMAICGVLAGWSRWLELKLPPEDRIIAARIWPVCFVLVGLILIFYRES